MSERKAWRFSRTRKENRTHGERKRKKEKTQRKKETFLSNGDGHKMQGWSDMNNPETFKTSHRCLEMLA